MTPPRRANIAIVGEVIRADRLRAAMTLVAEVHEIGANSEAGRRHLVDGAVELVGGAIGGAVHDTSYGLGLRCGIAQATLVNFDSQSIDVFQAHHVHGSAFNPFHARVMERKHELEGNVFTSTSEELVERTTWERSPYITDYARPARVDHFIASLRLVAGATASFGIGFMRAASDRPFTAEDRELLHAVVLAVGPFFDAVAPTLTPRMRQTLDELRTGASDKEIARRLSLSPHTVRQYVKAILRAFGVASRTELITRAAGTRAARASGRP